MREELLSPQADPVEAAEETTLRPRRSVLGVCTERIASASFGPTPVAEISTSNVSRSSRLGKP